MGLFNLVRQEGFLPHQWMKGIVIFLPKPAKRGKRGFRQITIFSKVRISFEQALLPRLESELAISKFQGGLKRHHKTHHKTHHWAV